MGEARDNKLKEIAILKSKAIELKLVDAQLVAQFTAEELLGVYNGIGPEWLPYEFRLRLTEYLAVFAPACLIHDFHYWTGDGNRADFDRANDILERNCRACIKAETKWYQLVRRAAGYSAAHLMAEACRRYGWAAYRAGMVEGIAVEEQSRVKECSLTHALTLTLVLSILLSGCYRAITVTRLNDYELKYRAVGLKTDVSKIEAEKMTNGTVRVLVEGVATDVSDRNRMILESGGTAIGNIAERVVEGLK